MADVNFRFNPEFLRWLRTSDTPDNPCVRELDRVADLILHEAKARAPIARKAVYTKGRRFYTPPGYLRDHLVKADRDHDDLGNLSRFVGTRRNEGHPYPFAFISNVHGFTRNRGGRTIRSAVDYFLQEAEATVPFTTERVWP